MNGMGCCGMEALGAPPDPNRPWELSGDSATCSNGERIPPELMKPHYERWGRPLGRDAWCDLTGPQRQALIEALSPFRDDKLDPKIIIGGVMVVAALALLLRK